MGPRVRIHFPPSGESPANLRVFAGSGVRNRRRSAAETFSLALRLGRQVPALITVFESAGTAVMLQRSGARSMTEGSNPALSNEESNANLMPTTFSQPAVQSLRNRLPIARSR